MVDKYSVKDYVSNMIGRQYVVPCLGRWDNADEIDFDKLPNQFVLKTNPISSKVFVCKDKSSIENVDVLRHQLNRKLNMKSAVSCLGEWPYKNVKPCIIAEGYLDDHTNDVLQDYKRWCFDGKHTFMYFSVKRDGVYENFYDMDFHPVHWINHNWPRGQPEFEKPTAFDEMKSLAAKLSEGIPFLRVDFYVVKGKVFFGEMTFFDWAGLRPFVSYDVDARLGEYIKI